MYNGVGVSTPRGTGTSGYVEASLALARTTKNKPQEHEKRFAKKSEILIEHEKRRKIEVKCLELRNKLKSSGKSDEDILKEVNEFRESLLNPKPKEILTPKMPADIEGKQNEKIEEGTNPELAKKE